MLLYPTRFDPKKFGNTFLAYYAPHKVYHPGTDFNWGPSPNSDRGQDVVAPASGVVVYVSPRGTNGGLGNYLVIHHPQFGVWTRYLHLEEVLVGIGQHVGQGDRIALLGDTGTVSAHLHLEVLNEKGLAFVRDWTRPYGRYPLSLSKSAVKAMFLDPIKWIESNTEAVASVVTDVQKRAEQRKQQRARQPVKGMLDRKIARRKSRQA